MHRTFRYLALPVLAVSLLALPARAESKDMIMLQTQVQQLQDAVARLQQANDERMGVLKDLVQQTADSVNKMSVAVNGVQLGLQNEKDAATARNEQLSGQVQSLNDSIDELKARMGRMEKALNDIQGQQQSTNAMLGNLPQPGQPAAAPVDTPPPTSSTKPITKPGAKPTKPAAGTLAPVVAPEPPPPAAAPTVAELYRMAYSDFMSAKYPLASSEFADVIKAYPDDNLSGNAWFYLGEINVRALKPTAAVKDYDQVLERYPDNSKIPAAHLHKANALFSMKQTDKGTLELRALIQRFPNSPEASQARAKLAALRSASRE